MESPNARFSPSLTPTRQALHRSARVARDRMAQALVLLGLERASCALRDHARDVPRATGSDQSSHHLLSFPSISLW